MADKAYYRLNAKGMNMIHTKVAGIQTFHDYMENLSDEDLENKAVLASSIRNTAPEQLDMALVEDFLIEHELIVMYFLEKEGKAVTPDEFPELSAAVFMLYILESMARQGKIQRIGTLTVYDTKAEYSLPSENKPEAIFIDSISIL